MGGQSAFGSKAGDTFTRITVATATVWIILCVVAAKYLGTGSPIAAAAGGSSTQSQEVNPDDTTLGVGPLGTELGAEPSGTDPNVLGTTPASDAGGTSADTASDNAATTGAETPAESGEN
jgi:preprotein translocase subunit SecG